MSNEAILIIWSGHGQEASAGGVEEQRLGEKSQLMERVRTTAFND